MPSKCLTKISQRETLTVEGFFNAVIFANYESDSALGIFDAFKLIKVCLPLEQSVHSSWVSVVTCVVQWGPLSVILGHDVRSLTQEELQALLAALFTS
jgi:hypothetical protein